MCESLALLVHINTNCVCMNYLTNEHLHQKRNCYSVKLNLNESLHPSKCNYPSSMAFYVVLPSTYIGINKIIIQEIIQHSWLYIAVVMPRAHKLLKVVFILCASEMVFSCFLAVSTSEMVVIWRIWKILVLIKIITSVR